MRLRPHDLCGTRQELRHDSRWLQRYARVRRLRVAANLRREWPSERVWHRHLRPDHLRRPEQGLWVDIRRLQSTAVELRQLRRAENLRRRRDTECLWVHANDVRGTEQKLRLDPRRMRRHAELRRLHGAEQLRR